MLYTVHEHTMYAVIYLYISVFVVINNEKLE